MKEKNKIEEMFNKINHLHQIILGLASSIDETIRCRRCNDILSIQRLLFLPEPKLCFSCRLEPIKVYSDRKR